MRGARKTRGPRPALPPSGLREKNPTEPPHNPERRSKIATTRACIIGKGCSGHASKARADARPTPHQIWAKYRPAHADPTDPANGRTSGRGSCGRNLSAPSRAARPPPLPLTTSRASPTAVIPTPAATFEGCAISTTENARADKAHRQRSGRGLEERREL